MALKNTQFDALMREYNRRQADNYRRQAQCIDKIHKEIPQIKLIEEEIRSASVEQAAARIKGDDSGREAYRRHLEELIGQKQALLSSHGYPPDYMEMHYTCPDCKDTGYIGDSRCHCFIKAASAIRYDQSGLQQILEKENFSVLSDRYYDDTKALPELGGLTVRQHMRRIAVECLQYAQNFSSRPDSLLFIGEAGVGKPFLAHCLAKALLDQGFSVLFFTAGQLFQMFSSQIDNREDVALKELDQDILSCDLLIIDDLGTELGNSFDNSKLFYCINQRLLLGKATLISTNLSGEAITERYSERVSSRLMSDYRVKRLFGCDIRKEKAKENR